MDFGKQPVSATLQAWTCSADNMQLFSYSVLQYVCSAECGKASKNPEKFGEYPANQLACWKAWLAYMPGGARH